MRPLRKRLTLFGAAVMLPAALLQATSATGAGTAAALPRPAAVPAQIAGSVDYLTKSYHISAGDAERRLTLQSEASLLAPRLAAAYPADYAGMWLDQAHGGYLDVAMRHPALLASMIAALTERVWIRAVPARYSSTQLTSLAPRLATAADPVADGNANAAVDASANQVDVQVPAGAIGPARAALARLDLPHDEYRVSAAATSTPAGCSTNAYHECDPPMRGGVGVQIWNQTKTAQTGSCTNGFEVHGSNGLDYTLTAGHCFESGGYYTRTESSDGTLHWIGTLTNAIVENDYPNDFALLPYDTSAGSAGGNAYWIPSHQPQFQVLAACDAGQQHPEPCTSSNTWPIKGMYTYDQIGTGWVVCATGATTNTYCGSVTSKDGGIVTNICRRFGDSGGPLFSENDDMAYGIMFGTRDANVGDPCISNEWSQFSPLSTIFSTAQSASGVSFSLHTTGGGVTSAEHALWSGDSYNGSPLSSITLNSGQVSNTISVSFRNEGAGSWDANTVLAEWSGSGDGPPANGDQFCHAPGSDWSTCDPGVAAWIGYATVGSGGTGTFQFQIQAPTTSANMSSTLYFRPAERQTDGSYQWIDADSGDGLAGNRTYDYFTVNVNG